MKSESPSTTVITAVTPSLSTNTPQMKAKIKTTNVFVKVASSEKSNLCAIPADSKTRHLRRIIFEQLNLPRHLQVTQILYQGRALPQRDIAHQIRAYTTLTLVDTKINGGSRRIIHQSDDSDDDSFKPAINAPSAVSKSKSKVAKAKKTPPGISEPTQKPTKNFSDSFTKVVDNSKALLEHSTALLGNQDHVGLGHTWANTDAFASAMINNPLGIAQDIIMIQPLSHLINNARKQLIAGISNNWANTDAVTAEMLKNPLGLAKDIVQPLKHLIINARKQLIAQYQIPECNEALQSLADVLPDLQKQFDSLGHSEPILNAVIEDFYKEADLDTVGHFSTSEFQSFCRYLFSMLPIEIEEKDLVLLSKAIDVNGDGKFDQDEIVHKYTREERKAWFARKRAAFEEIKKRKEEKLTKRMQQKKESKDKSHKSQNEVRSDDKGSAKQPGQDDPNEDDQTGRGGSGSDEVSEENDWDKPERYTESIEKQVDDQSDAQKTVLDEEDHLFGENCFYRLFRLRNEQEKSTKAFEEKISADEVISDALNGTMQMLAQTVPWYGKITTQQSYLLKAILQQAFVDKRIPCKKYDSWEELISECNLKLILPLILSLGPELFRASLVLTEIDGEDRDLLETIESAACDSMLKMIMETIDDSDETLSSKELFKKFKKFFTDANFLQQCLMLRMTNSKILQASWIDQLSEDQLLDIVRSQGRSGEMNFPLLALCSQEKLSKVCQKLSEDEKKYWSVWQQMQAVGQSNRDFKDLKAMEETLVRTINLPCDYTRYLVQIPMPGSEGEFLRLEQQTNAYDASFELENEEDDGFLVRAADSGYCLSLLKFSSQSQQIETFRQISFSGQPQAIKTGKTFSFANAMLFTGEQGQAFWFTKALDGENYRVNMISDNSSEIKTSRIHKDSFLHTYLSLGNYHETGEDQRTRYLPQGEPKMVKIHDKELILFSYFQNGQKLSIFGFCLESGKELVQLEGACFYVHQYVPKPEEPEYGDHSEKIIVFCPNEICAGPITSKGAFASLRCNESHNIHMKRVTLDPSSWSSDKLTVIEVMSVDSFNKLVESEDYSVKQDKDLQKALIKNDSDWISPQDQWKLEKEFLAGGSYKASTHLGPDNKTFVTIENSNFQAKQTLVYEVKASNHVQAIFNSEKVSSSKSFFTKAVSSGPKTSPKILVLDVKNHKMVLLDLLEKADKGKRTHESGESGSDSANEDDSVSESEEKLDFTDTDDMVVYVSIIPENLSMMIGQFVTNFKAYFTPSLVDGVLVSSCLDVDQKYREFQVRQAPKDEEDEEREEHCAKAKVISNQLNSADSWRINFSYPLLACVDSLRTDEIMIFHMANGSNEQLQLKLDMGQFIGFIQLDTSDKFTNIAFLSYDSIDKRTKLFILSLRNSFQQAAILKINDWYVQVHELPEKFQKLHAIKAKIKSLKLLRLGRDKKEFAVICQTQDDILFITEKGVIEIFETKGDDNLANIEMLCSQNGQNYFITEELSSQTNFIYELSAKYNEDAKKFETSCEKVFTFTSGTVLSIQLNRDNEQMMCYNYTHAKKVSFYDQIKLDCKTDLMVLDSSNNLFKLSQPRSGANFVESENRNLTKEEGLKQIEQQKTQQESLVLSERTVIFRDQVLNIESGRTYEALHDVLPTNQKVLSCQIVPKSDKIMYKSMFKNQLQLLFKRDAGRRNCNPVGFEELRDCKSVNQISNNLMLFEIRSDQGQSEYAKEESCWTYVTLDEQIMELHPALDEILMKGWTQVESRIVRGNICQLLLIKEEFGMSRDLTIEKRVNNSEALMLELTNTGNLLRKTDIILDKQGVDVQVIQNFAGQLLQIKVATFTNSAKGETESVPTVTPQKLESNSSICPCLVTFDSAMQGTEYLYIGDYLCWLNPHDHCIKAIDLTKKEEDRETKEIFFNEFIGKTPQNQIGISECKPYSAIRFTQLSQVNEAVIRKVSNCVQLTLGNYALIYNLNDESPKPAHEISAMHHLIDPQNFVDCGANVQNFVTKRSYQFSKEGLVIQTNAGNYTFGIKEWLEPSQFGNSVMVKQKSNLPLHQTHENDQWHRPVIGIYKLHCEADLMEVQYLIEAAESGVKPKRIDVKTLWAQYGQEIIFSFLQGNLRILTAIRDQLGALELEDLEDIDGSESYHPDLRRLSDILMRKTALIKENEGKQVALESFLSMNLAKSGLRDAILKVGRVSPNFSLLKQFCSQDDFQRMVKHGTSQTILELEHCFYQTRSTRQIQLLDWPRDLDLFTVRSQKCTITREELDVHLEGTEDRVTRAVKVSTANLKWFFRDKKNFVAITQILQGLPNKVYASIFVECLLDQFWKISRRDIVKYQFVPYLVFVASTLWFFVVSLSERDNLPEGQHATPQWLIWIGGLIVLALLSNQYRLKSYQFVALKNKLDYFKSLWNMIDFISLSLTLIIVLTSVFRHTLLPIKLLRPIAAIASCTLMMKVFDWLRLFQRTAFYILLVEETMRDVSSFLILLMTALMMFGVPMVMLNLNRVEDNSVVDEPFGFWGINMLLNQYLLALGEFSYDNFANEPQSYMCYMFFVFATFITQIAMLNMLIAIMGDTYERVIENRVVNATKTKLDLMSDLAGTLDQKSAELDQDCFMFIVQPDDDDGDEGDDWEGTVNKMTCLTANNINDLGKQLNSKSDQIQDSIHEFTRKDQMQDKHLKAHVDSVVKSSQKQLNLKIAASQETIEKISASQELTNEKHEKQFKAINATLSVIIDKLDGKPLEQITETKKKRRASAMAKDIQNALGSKLGENLARRSVTGIKGFGAKGGLFGNQ